MTEGGLSPPVPSLKPGRLVGDELWPPPSPIRDARLKYTEPGRNHKIYIY